MVDDEDELEIFVGLELEPPEDVVLDPDPPLPAELAPDAEADEEAVRMETTDERELDRDEISLVAAVDDGIEA